MCSKVIFFMLILTFESMAAPQYYDSRGPLGKSLSFFNKLLFTYTIYFHYMLGKANGIFRRQYPHPPNGILYPILNLLVMKFIVLAKGTYKKVGSNYIAIYLTVIWLYEAFFCHPK